MKGKMDPDDERRHVRRELVSNRQADMLMCSLSGYLLVTLALLTAHLGGAHSTWSGGQPFFAKVAAFWVGLPLIWLGLLLRVRYVYRMPSSDLALMAARARCSSVRPEHPVCMYTPSA
jgi:hypothetical protein